MTVTENSDPRAQAAAFARLLADSLGAEGDPEMEDLRPALLFARYLEVELTRLREAYPQEADWIDNRFPPTAPLAFHRGWKETS